MEFNQRFFKKLAKYSEPYASCTKPMKYISSTESNKEILNQWKRTYRTMDSGTYGQCKCICGHQIRYRHYIKNELNGNQVYVGSSCIDTFFTKPEKANKKICPRCFALIAPNDYEYHQNTHKITTVGETKLH